MTVRDSRPILVVTPTGASCPVDTELSETNATLVMDESAALEVVATRVLAGLIVIVDGRGPLRVTKDLVDRYLRSQPMGHVAILSAAPCATMSTQFAIVPHRVDVFFAPWDLASVREFLRLKSPCADAVPA
jgi:hypothetical protein